MGVVGRGGGRAHAWAALALAACVLVYLWPVLVGGKILSPGAFLYQYVPWQSVAPPTAGRYTNGILGDLPLVDYPWRVLARQFIHEGTFPAWNPYALGGIPFYSNPQTGLFSPFNLPLWILPLTYGLGVSAALKLLAGGFGAYLLARQLRLGVLPGLLAGISFAFAAINIVWLAHETLPGVVVMAPWAIWLVERVFERGRLGSAVALAGVIAVGLSGGHPGLQVHLLVVTSLYALLRAACSRGARSSPVSLFRALALIGGGLATGALLMAFMLIPEVRGSHDTLGVAARHTGQLPGARMPFKVAASALFPDWWGRSGRIDAPVTPSNLAAIQANYCERTFYAGAVALVLAGIGLVARRSWRRTLPFAIVGLIGLAIAVRVPGLIWLATHLPVLESVGPHRLVFAFELAVAVLAAFGLQEILDAPTGVRWRLVVVLVAGVVALVAAIEAHPSGAQLRDTLDHFLTGRNYPDGAVLALTSVTWFALFLLGVAALVLLARLRPAWGRGAAVALVVLAAVDAYHFVHGFQPMGPESVVMPPRTPSIAFLQRHRDDGRTVGLEMALPPDAGLVYGLRDVRGYDPPQPTRRMLSVWRLANPIQASWAPLVVETIDAANLRVLNVLGARYIVTPPGTRFPRRTFPDLSIAYDGPDATILASAATPPRAFVPTETHVTPRASATGAAIVEAAFDPRREVAVERDQAGVAALAHGLPVHGTATIVRERDASVTLRAQLDRRGLVVLNDQLLDGWSVRVDGHATKPLYVNEVMRGVIVPAGRHEIAWDYRVPGLRLGALLSAATFVLLAALGIGLRVRARRPRDRLPRAREAPMLRA
jgi:hypothetical protein